MNEAALAAAIPPAELATYQRIGQLQALIEEAKSIAVSGSAAPAAAAATPGGGEAAGGGDFASALQRATTAAYAPAVATSTAYSPSATPATMYAPESPAAAAYEPSLAGEQASGEVAGAAQYEPLIDAAAQRNGIEPALLHGLIEQESGFNAGAQSGAGASGLTQLMPSTAASMGVADPFNAAESIEGGARYLGELMRQFGGSTTDALAAYNAGPGAVQQYGGVPPYAETQDYVTRVLANAQNYNRSHPQPLAGVPA